MRVLTRAGYSFESYCTSDTPAREADQERRDAFGSSEPTGWGGEVDTNVQWCHIVKSRLGASRLIIGGEVDCVQMHDDGKESVVELKTNMVLRRPEDEMKLSVKMLRMYMQSFLLGVQTIVVGFRDAHGTLDATRSYKTRDLPRTVRGKPGEWNANHNLAFGAAIVDFVRAEVAFQTERWLSAICAQIRCGEATQGKYSWRQHCGNTSFLSHLPLPCPADAVLDYPVFRVSFLPPFTHVVVRYVPPPELQQDGRRHGRVGIVPADFYSWATRPA